jgi:hypothetical protein
MGLLDRLRGRRDAADDAAGTDESDLGVPPPVDVPARSAQLLELDDALRALARGLAADPARMRVPGHAQRVEDYRAVAAEAARLERDGFDRADLTDLANQVVPLTRPGAALPREYEGVAEPYARVLAATDALRAVLASEDQSDAG